MSNNIRSSAFKKGNPGKPKGAVNKINRDIKEAYRLLVEKNLDNLSLWLEKIADKNPEKAILIIKDLSEFVIPRLARQELTGKDGEKIKFNVTLKKYNE